MAADGKVQAELDRVFHFLGILQELSDVMATNLTTLNSKVNNSVEIVEDLIQEESAAGEEEICVVLEESNGGAEMRQVEKDNQRPVRMEVKENKVRMMKTWYEMENEDWGLSPMGSPKDLWTTNSIKVKIEVFGTFGTLVSEKTKKQDLDFFFEYGGLVRKNTDPSGSKLLRDLMFNMKDCQQNRRKGTERDLRASDVIDPG